MREPLLIASKRWRKFDLPVKRRFQGVQPHDEVAGAPPRFGARR